jgi:hypothetical protein
MKAFPFPNPSTRSPRLCRAVFLPGACFGLLLGSAGPAAAQALTWDVNGQTAVANYPLLATVLDSHWSDAGLTLGSGVTASGTANTFGGFGFDQTSLADAITGGDYLAFTLSPADGSSFDISSVSLLFGVGTAVANFNVALTSDRTGFDAAQALWSYSFSTASPPTQSVSLAEFGDLQDLSAAVEFRLYGWRDSSGTTTFRIRDNSGADLSVFGTGTAIPEPADAAGMLGGAILIGAGLFRRWQRARAFWSAA